MRERTAEIVVALALLVGLVAAQVASAAAISDEEELAKFGKPGSGAGQVGFSQGMATDPLTGHVYLGENGSDRISEFTPWGGFVKAFGWDVAPSSVNEQQEVRVTAAEGQFKLSFEGEETPSLPFDASGAEVKAALEGLGSIGAGDLSVKETAGVLDGTVPIVYVLTFRDSLAAADVGQLGAEDVSLGGGVPSSSLVVRTRADGHAATTGLESCTEESGCKLGLKGSGAGQLDQALGVAVDAAGEVFVFENNNHRVQKFDSAGRFVAMFGGEVDKTTGENLCTAASGHECGIGLAGTGNGEFGSQAGGGWLALCPAGTALCPSGALFVGDSYRIERLNLEGEYESQCETGPGSLQQLAFDPASEDLYASFTGKGEAVYKLDPSTCAQLGELKGAGGGQGAVATDAAGDVFMQDGDRVLEFDAAGDPLAPPSCCEDPVGLRALATDSAGTLYAAYFKTGVDSFIRAFGPTPIGFEAPPKRPPEITAQFASSVQRDGATLAALINPHFWPDAHYFLQYGTAPCEPGGCEEVPVPPGVLLTTRVSGVPLKTAGINLEGLAPETTYHYRFVAQSGGGGPVFGEGGGEAEQVGEETIYKEIGEESTFKTYPEPRPPAPCPNDAFRGGLASRLPDCRAYEMVSPVDKNNGDIKALIDPTGFSDDLPQSASDGNRITYTSYRGFGAPESAPYVSQYLAARDTGSGWQSESIDPPIGPAGVVTESGVPHFENFFKAFSADLCRSWLVVAGEPGLAPGATEDENELYRREDCGPESYEALIQVSPSGETPPSEFLPELQGASEDGKAAILRVQDKLVGATGGLWQAYYASAGALKPLCIGPKGTQSGGSCSGGTGGPSVSSVFLYRVSSLSHALSEDGTRAYWTDSGTEEVTGPGKVYLRLNPGAPEASGKDGGGNCIPEAGKACTVKVSQTKTAEASRFLGASADGGKALFEVTAGTLEGNLYLFTLGSGSSLIAGKVVGVAGASEDLSRVYFVSEEALDGAAVEGRPNLYLSHEGTSFIATLSKADVADPSKGNETPSDTAAEPIDHAARATPDGKTLAFISTEPLTGYDNADLLSGKADSEVYLYEAGSPGPVCVSCNPGRARPQGRVVEGLANNPGRLPTAAALPLPLSDLYAPRVISEDGGRVFFNSFDALLPRDTNGAEDVYEWEKGSSQEDCEEKGAEVFAEASEGCLSLISTGQSPQDSHLIDTSEGGRDAFFTTNASLLPSDPGLIDIYDARSLGGFPPPPPEPAQCRGEACQAPATSANHPTPSSFSYKGPENEKPKKKHRHKKKHHKKHHSHKRRAGR